MDEGENQELVLSGIFLITNQSFIVWTQKINKEYFKSP